MLIYHFSMSISFIHPKILQNGDGPLEGAYAKFYTRTIDWIPRWRMAVEFDAIQILLQWHTILLNARSCNSNIRGLLPLIQTAEQLKYRSVVWVPIYPAILKFKILPEVFFDGIKDQCVWIIHSCWYICSADVRFFSDRVLSLAAIPKSNFIVVVHSLHPVCCKIFYCRRRCSIDLFYFIFIHAQMKYMRNYIHP